MPALAKGLEQMLGPASAMALGYRWGPMWVQGLDLAKAMAWGPVWANGWGHALERAWAKGLGQM